MEDCTDCIGTGISPYGRVEDNCPSCRGTGVILESHYEEPEEDDHSQFEDLIYG